MTYRDLIFPGWTMLATALHEAARLAQILRANNLMIVNGVVYGPAGHGITISFASHTQTLAQLRAVEEERDTLRQENAYLRGLRGDDEPEFGPEILEPADR